MIQAGRSMGRPPTPSLLDLDYRLLDERRAVKIMSAVVSTSEVVPGSDLMTALPENMPHGISLRLFCTESLLPRTDTRCPCRSRAACE